ncbi:alpha-tocopherol transfer protein-like [Tribolium castaneum]|uniref:Alpha-tocopherol transfer protein-like n=1 Tax=Tribolium castaneum TaxID=7070 RepID=A0A139WGJ3_TRICA|nr:PREDICTED: alpha-tocopherol transfer protein-like [Tribolium castaneum]KYB26927.1 Alpha-tocopherol transfer protein-like [Tribolium castaneum]|eukprot:XP_001810229.1 PREDICTED: alpha-tocopherol transfer protein-like [Tribolium castaneum]
MALQYQFKAKSIVDEGRTTQTAIDNVKEWLKNTKLPQLPEELIVLFLLSCQNNLNSVRNTIQAYFKIKNEAPEIFNSRDIDCDELKKARKVVSCISIPVRMPNNTVIHFFKLNDTNYQNFDWVHSMKLSYMLLDVTQRRNPPNELVVVIDMKGVGFMHITRLRIGAAKKFLEFLQEAMPLKIKMIHILNSNYVFDKLLSIVKFFIKSDLMSIIKSHPPETDMNQFYKDCIPSSCLPKEYGGELATVEEMNEKMIQEFRELKPFFEAEEKLRSYCK